MEVSESAVGGRGAGVVERSRKRLNEAGLSIALDDCGTGYSSLSYLKKFPIDIIKIDRSFIHEIPDNQDDMEITSAVVVMAHNLKLKVVDEGIETAVQLAVLRREAMHLRLAPWTGDRAAAIRTIAEQIKFPAGSAERLPFRIHADALEQALLATENRF